MKLFEILLPSTDWEEDCPAWQIVLRHKHDTFRAYLTEVAGGHTMLPEVEGEWWSDASGKTVSDTSIPYRVATTHIVWRLVVKKAFELFPDEETIMCAEIGTATIEARPQVSDK